MPRFSCRFQQIRVDFDPVQFYNKEQYVSFPNQTSVRRLPCIHRQECDLPLKTKRNGEIDLLRFLCAAVIVIHHFNELFPSDLMVHGYTFVKFFFMVSGYLMVCSAEKLGDLSRDPGAIASATWSFILKKIGSFYPYYIAAILTQIILFYVILDYQGILAILKILTESVPALTLTFYGFNTHTALYTSGSWYLSVMVIALFVLFPLVLRYRDLGTKVILPLLSIFILGYMNYSFGTVSTQTAWGGICAAALLQGMGQISLGASLRPLVKHLQSSPRWLAMTKDLAVNLVITVLKIACYFVAFYHAQCGTYQDIHVLLLLAVGLLLSFSGGGFVIPACRVTRYLGRISLPVYLFHNYFGYAVYYALMPFAITPVRCLIISLCAIIGSAIAMYPVDICTKKLVSAFRRKFPTV